MKAYIVTTGVIFGLITLAHVVRMVVEPHVVKEPLFNVLTIIAVALCVWAWRLFRQMSAARG